MRSPVYALIWEQWRQVRMPIAMGVGVTLIGSWSLRVILVRAGMPADEITENWVVPSMFVAAFALMLIGAVLLFAHSSPRDLRMALPPRMLTLPVSRIRLALTQVIFRIATIALAALTVEFGLALIDPSYLHSLGGLAGVSVLGFAYASALAATVGKRMPVFAFVLTLVSLAPVLATVNRIQERVGPVMGLGHGTFLLFAAVCMLVSFAGIVGVRRNVPGLDRFSLRLSLPSFARAGRNDTAAGQFSLEWQRIGWFPVSFTALCAAAIVVATYVTDQDKVRFLPFLFMVLSALPVAGLPVVAFLTGMILMAREYRDGIGGFARFSWTRPVTVQQVVVARMKAVSLSLLGIFGTVFFLTVVLGLLIATFKGTPFNLSVDVIKRIEFPVMFFVGMAILSWCIVWVPYVPVFCLVYLAIVNALTANVHGWQRNADFWLFVVPNGAGLLVLLVLAYACWKRRIFDKRIVFSAVALCGTIFTIALFELHRFEISSLALMYDTEYYTMTAFVLSLMPLFALLWQGVLLDRVRHGALFRSVPARLAER